MSAIPTALPDGTYDVQATATDNAGNSGSDTTTNELVVNTGNPAVVVTPLVTNNNKPTLSGTLDSTFAAGGISSMTVKVGTQTLPAAVVDTLGTWTWSVAVPTALPDGTYDVQATATNTAGFIGSDNTTNELVVDTVAPTVAVNPIGHEQQHADLERDGHRSRAQQRAFPAT